MKQLEEQHSKAIENLKAEHASTAAACRAALERAHAERTRTALSQLRAEAEQEARNADRKLREVTTRVSVVVISNLTEFTYIFYSYLLTS